MPGVYFIESASKICIDLYYKMEPLIGDHLLTLIKIEHNLNV